MTTLDGFDSFDRRPFPRSALPTVTIQKRGSISLNNASYQHLGEPEAVELLFNPVKRIVAFKPINPDQLRAHRLRPTGSKSKTFILSGVSFVKHHKIDITVGRRYLAEAGVNVLFADLTGDSVEVRSNRARALPGKEPSSRRA